MLLAWEQDQQPRKPKKKQAKGSSLFPPHKTVKFFPEGEQSKLHKINLEA